MKTEGEYVMSARSFNQARVNALSEALDKLAMAMPRAGTFCDSYANCLRDLRDIRDNLQQDTDKNYGEQQ